MHDEQHSTGKAKGQPDFGGDTQEGLDQAVDRDALVENPCLNEERERLRGIAAADFVKRESLARSATPKHVRQSRGDGGYQSERGGKYPIVGKARARQARAKKRNGNVHSLREKEGNPDYASRLVRC